MLELDLLSTINIVRVGENANGHARTGDIGKSDGELAVSRGRVEIGAHFTVPEKRLSR